MKHNPWIGVLWAIAVVLIVAAFAAGVWQSSFYYQSSEMQNVGPVVEFVQRVVDAVQYPAVMVGFATIGGLLFLHARNHASYVNRAGR